MDLEQNKKNAIAFYKIAYEGNPKRAVEKYIGNPLCILNNADFNVVDVPVKDEPVDELYNCQCRDL